MAKAHHTKRASYELAAHRACVSSRTRHAGGVWRVPDDWPGGARHGGGMSLVCGARMEHGKARLDTVVVCV
jgi:hypothetical protein